MRLKFTARGPRLSASQAVAANTAVELMRDADSTASLEDYKLAPPLITIMMGDTSGPSR